MAPRSPNHSTPHLAQCQSDGNHGFTIRILRPTMGRQVSNPRILRATGRLRSRGQTSCMISPGSTLAWNSAQPAAGPSRRMRRWRKSAGGSRHHIPPPTTQPRSCFPVGTCEFLYHGRSEESSFSTMQHLARATTPAEDIHVRLRRKAHVGETVRAPARAQVFRPSRSVRRKTAEARAGCTLPWSRDVPLPTYPPSLSPVARLARPDAESRTSLADRAFAGRAQPGFMRDKPLRSGVP